MILGKILILPSSTKWTESIIKLCLKITAKLKMDWENTVIPLIPISFKSFYFCYPSKGNTVLSPTLPVNSNLASMIENVSFVELIKLNKCIRHQLDQILISAWSKYFYLENNELKKLDQIYWNCYCQVICFWSII